MYTIVLLRLLKSKYPLYKIKYMMQCTIKKKTCNYLYTKVGIRNFSPHLRNSAMLRTTKSIAELRTKKSCGTAIADLLNLTSAIPQLSAVSSQLFYFLLPFPQLRMLLKLTKSNFYKSVSMETKNLHKRDSSTRFFASDFFS
jgi:hypothetical protein